jgi:hypothetical protein
MAAVIQACDVSVIRSTQGSTPCRPSSRPWVIAAASLGSGMAFLDITVLNVALPAVQADLEAAALAIVGASFEGRLRAKAIGLWGALSGTAMAVGPILGCWLVKEATHRRSGSSLECVVGLDAAPNRSE